MKIENVHSLSYSIKEDKKFELHHPSLQQKKTSRQLKPTLITHITLFNRFGKLRKQKLVNQ